MTATAGPAGATLQLLTEAQEKMGIPAPPPESPPPDPPADEPVEQRRGRLSRLASRCWALLLARIYECLPLQCPHCGEPIRIIAFVTDPEMVGRILRHVGEPTEAPRVLPARATVARPGRRGVGGVCLRRYGIGWWCGPMGGIGASGLTVVRLRGYAQRAPEGAIGGNG